MLSVAETAAWLMAERLRQAIATRTNGRMGLILADVKWVARAGRDLFAMAPYKAMLSPSSVQMLPWWSHNQHMTLFLGPAGRGAKRRVRPTGGIFFVRRLRASRIAPMVLHTEKDLTVALDIFAAYWYKALTEPSRDPLKRRITLPSYIPRPKIHDEYVDPKGMNAAYRHLSDTFGVRFERS
jgi:hypothetical protein